MRWNEIETYEFVKLYLSYEYLWNSHHEHYKLNNRRMNAYKDIVTKFNESTGILLTLSDLRCKIKNLRSTYSQELAKIKSRSGPDYTYRPTIKWFSHWHKKFKHLRRHKAADSTSTLEEPDETDNSSQKVWMENVSDNLNEPNLDPFISGNDDYTLFLKAEPEEDNQTNRHSPCKIKRKKLKDRSPSTDVSERTVRESSDSNVVGSSKEDEFDIYGKFVASQLRNMDLSKALRLQLEIQSLISTARLSDLS